jgi:putative salt-induced outer membrane protein
MARTLALCVLLFSMVSFAQEQSAEKVEVKSPWKNESELSAVIISGNTDSQSTSFKQTSSYTFSHNTLLAKGRYLTTRTSGVNTARAWDATGRYERALSNYWSVYTSYGAESDIFAGYIQRDNLDIGAKYFFIKKEKQELIGESGYRYTHTYSPGSNKYENFGRLYSQYKQKITETAEGKFWIEYLPNFSNSDAYLLNAEPSLSVSISKIFSVKMSYLMKYQGVVPAGFTEHLDTTYSTALVANF